MTVTKQKKQGQLVDLVEVFKNTNSVVFVNYQGLSVAQLFELRTKLWEAGARMKVAKNTLIIKALKEAEVKVDLQGFDGPVGVVYKHDGDETAPARIVHDFAKKNEQLHIRVGILDAVLMDQAQVVQVAKLPSKLELVAKVVGSIKAPLSGLVGVTKGVMRNFVGALHAISEQKQ